MVEASAFPSAHNPLGFGCAYITGGFETRASARLLHAALDAGITYFDTAPMYGRGTSEAVIGEAFKGRRDRVAIATKAGIARPRLSLKTKLLRAVATPVRHLLPGLSRAAASSLYGGGRPANRVYTPECVRLSLEESLRLLKTDYVDVLLLHECEADDITEPLLETLSGLVAEGKVLKVGIGSSVAAIETIDQRHPETFDVYQRTWSVLKTNELLFPRKQNNFHRAILEALGAINTLLASDPAFAKKVSHDAGIDRKIDRELAKALLGASISVNPRGVTLFGSRRLARVEAYAREAATPANLARGAALLRIYRAATQHPD